LDWLICFSVNPNNIDCTCFASGITAVHYHVRIKGFAAHRATVFLPVYRCVNEGDAKMIGDGLRIWANFTREEIFF
jgi:hypothetical protein